ncbi:MAG TPA: hypothetical protein V6D15_09450 [Oculatellaceae cyanobacterium]|jgi:hypothetical protein
MERVQRMRYFAAISWRESRARLRTLPANERREILHEWDKSYRPKTHEYFADFITSKIRE